MDVKQVNVVGSDTELDEALLVKAVTIRSGARLIEKSVWVSRVGSDEEEAE